MSALIHLISLDISIPKSLAVCHPVFQEFCYTMHGIKMKKEGLLLVSYPKTQSSIQYIIYKILSA